MLGMIPGGCINARCCPSSLGDIRVIVLRQNQVRPKTNCLIKILNLFMPSKTKSKGGLVTTKTRFF